MKLSPSKLQLDILKRHVGPFIFCFLTVMFLLLMQFLILFIDRLIGKGLSLWVILDLIATNLAYMVVLAAPMAILVASLMAYGKFTEHNEMTALRAAGVNPIHIITPVLVAAGILSILLIWFSNDVLPNANQRARSLFLDIRTKKPAFNLKEGEFYKGIDGYTFLVKNMTANSDSLRNITLFQEQRKDRKRATIKAKKGHLKSNSKQTLTLYLNDGTVQRKFMQREHHEQKEVIEKTAFKRYRLTFDISAMAFSETNPNKHSRNDRTMNIQSMMAVVDTLKKEISKEKTKVYKTNNFIDANVEHRNTFHSINEQTKPPQKSRYLLLNKVQSKYAQDMLYQRTLSSLRSYLSSYDNLKVNSKWRTQRISKYWVEIYKKFSLPLACVFFVLIGAPIGIFSKKGNLGYAALIGTGFLVFYWISIIQGEKLADRGIISAFTGMWFSDIFLGIIGGVMLVYLCTGFRISDLWNDEKN